MSSKLQPAANDWEQTVLQVNDVIVPSGAPIDLVAGKTNDVTLQDPAQILRSVRAEIVNAGGLNIEVDPMGWRSSAGGLFTWTFTPSLNEAGRAQVVFFSREVTTVLEKDCRVQVEAPKYRVFVDGQLHEPGVDNAYPVRDKVMHITLVPKDEQSSTVRLNPIVGYPFSHESDPLVEVPVVVGPGGQTWTVKFSGSDRSFVLGFDTRPPTDLKMLPGYHDPAKVKLTSIVRTNLGSPTEPTDRFSLGVQTVDQSNVRMSEIRVTWRYNNTVYKHTTSNANGETNIVMRNYQTGFYSAELSARGVTYSVVDITI